MARSLCCCGLTGHPNWMRLHEVHRIERAKSMAGVSHPGELIGAKLEHDGVKLNRRPSPAHLAPLAGRGRIATSDANGSRERAPDDRLRIVRGNPGEGESPHTLPSQFAEAAPHPNPLRASFARLGLAKERGEER